MLLGIVDDPTFGHVLACATGGTLTEILGDRQLRLHPLTDVDAADMVTGLRGSVLLRGYRGSPPVDEPALVDAISGGYQRSRTCAREIRGLDINPLVVRVRGVCALDARVRIDEIRSGTPLTAGQLLTMSPTPTVINRHVTLVMAYGVSWVVWLPLALGVGAGRDSWWRLLHLAGALGPALGAVSVTAAEGQASFLRLWRRITDWRIGPEWYLVAWTLPFVLLAAVWGLARLTGDDAPVRLGRSAEYPMLPVGVYLGRERGVLWFRGGIGWRASCCRVCNELTPHSSRHSCQRCVGRVSRSAVSVRTRDVADERARGRRLAL